MLRHDLIRLAYCKPETRDSILPLLRIGMEFPSEKALKTYLDEHPAADKTKHWVKGREPEGERDDSEEPTEEDVEKKPDKKKPAKSPVHAVKALLNKIKGVSASMQKAVMSAPAQVQKILADSEARSSACKTIVTQAKKAPNKLASGILASAKKELHEIHHAGKAVAKLLKKPPQKWDKKDWKAAYSAGAYVVGGVIAASGGSPLLVAGALGKSFALHIGIKAVHEMADAGFLHYEWTESAFEAVHHLLASEKSDKYEKAFVEQMVGATIKVFEKGLTDKDIEDILSEKEPDYDNLKQPKIGERPGKK